MVRLNLFFQRASLVLPCSRSPAGGGASSSKPTYTLRVGRVSDLVHLSPYLSYSRRIRRPASRAHAHAHAPTSRSVTVHGRKNKHPPIQGELWSEIGNFICYFSSAQRHQDTSTTYRAFAFTTQTLKLINFLTNTITTSTFVDPLPILITAVR